MLATFVTASTAIAVALIGGWFALKSSDARGSVNDYIIEQLHECEAERDRLRHAR